MCVFQASENLAGHASVDRRAKKVEGPLKHQITNPLAIGFGESAFIFAQDGHR
jgi:hypothetical protein